MRKNAVVMTAVVVTLLGGVVWGYQKHAPLNALGKMLVSTVTPGKIVLSNNGQSFSVTSPIAFTTSRIDGSTTHDYQFLLCPNGFANEPAEGKFINDENEITFELESGTIYIFHTSTPENATLSDQTRPRVRTGRVIAQGEGTIFAVQCTDDEDRIMALKLGSGDFVKVKNSSNPSNVTDIDQANYFCTATSSGVGTASAVSSDDDATFMKSVIEATAKKYDLELP